MDMAYFTGQRPSDVLKMTDHDIQDGAITITQNKTGAKLRINIEGDLDNLIRKISERKAAHKVISFSLIVDDKDQRLTSCALRGHFDLAGKPLESTRSHSSFVTCGRKQPQTQRNLPATSGKLKNSLGTQILQ